MKSNFKNLLLIAFIALFAFYSCQDEVIEETQNEEQTLDPNSNVVNLLSATSANDGSTDNILDDSDCFSIQLPVTIVANGITITISTLEDLENLEDILDEFDDEDIEFLFPITIIFNNYTEVVIEDEDEFEAYIEDCFESVEDEDVIECVDFVYPISFSIFNTEFDVIDTILIENDQELYEFLEDLEDGDNAVIVSLNYPVTLVYADGSTVTVNSNAELEAALNEAEDDCYDEDDNCDINDVDDYLTTCHWELTELNDQDIDVELDFYFESNGTLLVKNEETQAVVEGFWNTSQTEEGVVLSIVELTDFASDYNGDWLLTECDDDEFEFEFIGDAAVFVEMTLEKECDDQSDCEAQEVFSNLVECIWYVGSNALPDDLNGPLSFDSDGSVYLEGSSSNLPIGSWSLELTDDGLFIIFNAFEAPYNDFNGEWQVIECYDGYFKILMGDAYIMFEQDCSNDNQDDVFDCFDDFVILKCAENNDDVATFDLLAETVGLVDCFAEFSATYHISIMDADANINAIATPEAYVSSSATIYMRIEAANGDYEVFELELVVEDCSQGNCDEAAVEDYLLTCIWNITDFNNADTLEDYDIDFNSNGTVTITGEGQTITATWSISTTSDGVVIAFDGVALPNIQAITGEWVVLECTPELLLLASLNANQDQMTLEQDCD